MMKMNNHEKILDILQKQNLTNEDKALINSLMANDPEAKKLYDAYLKMKDAFKSNHISFDNMRDYVLYKNNMEPEDRDIIGRIPLIENHLKSCEKCTNEFKILNEEFSGIESFLSAELNKGIRKSEQAQPVVYQRRQWWRTPVYAFSSLVVVGFLYLSLYLISNVTTPDTYQVASLSDKSEFYITRGRATDEFQETLKALENEQYDKAISHLVNDINENPDDETIFYSHYILGLTYLETAQKSFIGLFPSFDKEKAKSGLENFKLCIEKNTSGKFPDITNNAYFYSAKASLMLDDTNSAKKYLKVVVDNKGSKMSEARRLLNELE
jgi:tetratricopeptide (TPR) repeat protein